MLANCVNNIMHAFYGKYTNGIITKDIFNDMTIITRRTYQNAAG